MAAHMIGYVGVRHAAIAKLDAKFKWWKRTLRTPKVRSH